MSYTSGKKIWSLGKIPLTQKPDLLLVNMFWKYYSCSTLHKSKEITQERLGIQKLINFSGNPTEVKVYSSQPSASRETKSFFYIPNSVRFPYKISPNTLRHFYTELAVKNNRPQKAKLHLNIYIYIDTLMDKKQLKWRAKSPLP